MTEFRTNQPASVAHAALKATVQTMEKAKQNAVLWFGDILERKLYCELGYSSINQYASQELGFSSSRTGDFLNICRKLEKLPKVKAVLEKEELGYTPIREVVKVADETNEADWLKFAQENSRRALEREVKLSRQAAADKAAGQASLLPLPKTRPAAVVNVRVALEMSPTQFARYEALWEQARKLGSGPNDKIEALLEMLECYVAECSPRGDALAKKPVEAQSVAITIQGQGSSKSVSSEGCRPPVQIHIHQCPDCGKATVQTSKGELEISQDELEHAQCDCQVSQPGERNRNSIPPSIRRLVLARDRHRCQRPGCGNTKFLEVHHKVPRSQGGTNDATNLTILCSGCHALLHRKKWSQPQFLGKSV